MSPRMHLIVRVQISSQLESFWTARAFTYARPLFPVSRGKRTKCHLCCERPITEWTSKRLFSVCSRSYRSSTDWRVNIFPHSGCVHVTVFEIASIPTSFLLRCITTWLWRLSFVVRRFPQNAQAKSFSPVWVKMCLVKPDLTQKFLVQ